MESKEPCPDSTLVYFLSLDIDCNDVTRQLKCMSLEELQRKDFVFLDCKLFFCRNIEDTGVHNLLYQYN